MFYNTPLPKGSGNKSEVIKLNASEIQMRNVFYKGLVKQILYGIKQTIREKTYKNFFGCAVHWHTSV